MTSPKTKLSGEGVNSIARNAFYLVGNRWLQIIVRFFYMIVLARYLGPKFYGLFNYGLALYTAFLALSGLGLEIILIREVGRDRGQAARVVAQTLTIRTFMAVIAALACGTIGWFFEGDPYGRKVLLIFSIALIGRALAMWTEHLFIAYEASKYTFKLQAIFRPLESVFGLVILCLGGGIIAVAIVHASSWWMQALSGLELARRHLIGIRLYWAWCGLRGILSQGFVIGLGVVMITWLQAGPLVLFRYMECGENSLGQLALAMQGFMVLCTIPIAGTVASLPVLSRTVAREDGKDRLFVDALLRAVLILGAAAGMTGIALGPWLVNVIFGACYVDAGHLVGPAMWLLIPWTCGHTIWLVYLARDQVFLPTVFTGVGALILTLSMPWLVSSMDAAGAVLAAGMGMGVWALSLIVMFTRSGDLSLGCVILKPAGVALLSLAVFLVLDNVNVWLSLPVSQFVLFGGTFFLGVLAPDERSALLGFVRRKYGALRNNTESTG